MHYHGYYINHSSTPNCFWDRRTGDIYTQVDISEARINNVLQTKR